MKLTRCEKEESAAGVAHILHRLKATVERVLVSRSTGVGGNVWLAYGGLVELVVACVGDILRHGVKSKVRDDDAVLEWLRSSFDDPIQTCDQWIRDSLLQYCLRDHFTRLLHNRTALEEIYCPDAFLRLPPFVESLFSCLRALEEQQHKFLIDIDPALYLHSFHGKSLFDSRSLSFPVLSTTVHKFTSMECCSDFSENRNFVSNTYPSATNCCNTTFCFHCIQEVVEKLVATVSSHVQEQQQQSDRSLDSASSMSSLSVISSKSQVQSSKSVANAISTNRSHRRTRSDDVFLRRLPQNLSKPTTGDFGPSTSRQNLNEQKLGSLELIKESWREAAKLRDYIAQREYETSLELERENAHFLLSEMLIGAIEQMKWRNVLSSQWSNYAHSDSVGHAPTIRRPTTEEELTSASWERFSDGSGDNFLTTSSSDQTNSWSREMQTSSSYEAGPDFQNDISATFGDGRVQRPGPSTDAGYGTDGSRGLIHDPLQNRVSSAESVAMNLLQRFSQKHFSQSNELQYLVSYRDVPQLLLPLPQSTPVAPDEVYAEGFKQKVKLRGTFEWAPPRPQLIFKLHSVPKLKPLLEQQLFKCAGCGMKLDKAYFKRLRYCAYIGRLFCQRCHQGQTATIPAHILHKWDFRRLPVSDFSFRFLSQQHTAPVWNVKAANERLYDAVKALRAVRKVREQLRFCHDYIRTCRLAKELITTNGRLTDIFEKLQPHLVQETDIYSMQDFMEVKDGTLYSKLEAVLLLARYHIESCQYCRAKGFVCEICRKDEILFPFQATNRVKRCSGCGSCFHVKCLRKRECPKCRRLQSRELAVQDTSILEGEDELDS